MKILILFFFVLGSVCNAQESKFRTWEAVNGKKVEAEFVSNSDGQITLKMKTGKTFKVPLNKLSKADQDFLETRIPQNKKLTLQQAADIMSFDIGKWAQKGKGIPTNGESYDIELTFEASWKEEGKSVEYK
ncbi:MAG: SHD1 domain-containing protein, partial [Verrucomicrobiota bacterium]|nr:SHD1 domain-containing protein [Verrucomicrobiota bacterium]